MFGESLHTQFEKEKIRYESNDEREEVISRVKFQCWLSERENSPWRPLVKTEGSLFDEFESSRQIQICLGGVYKKLGNDELKRIFYSGNKLRLNTLYDLITVILNAVQIFEENKSEFSVDNLKVGLDNILVTKDRETHKTVFCIDGLYNLTRCDGQTTNQSVAEIISIILTCNEINHEHQQSDYPYSHSNLKQLPVLHRGGMKRLITALMESGNDTCCENIGNAQKILQSLRKKNRNAAVALTAILLIAGAAGMSARALGLFNEPELEIIAPFSDKSLTSDDVIVLKLNKNPETLKVEYDEKILGKKYKKNKIEFNLRQLEIESPVETTVKITDYIAGNKGNIKTNIYEKTFTVNPSPRIQALDIINTDEDFHPGSDIQLKLSTRYSQNIKTLWAAEPEQGGSFIRKENTTARFKIAEDYTGQIRIKAILEGTAETAEITVNSRQKLQTRVTVVDYQGQSLYPEDELTVLLENPDTDPGEIEWTIIPASSAEWIDLPEKSNTRILKLKQAGELSVIIGELSPISFTVNPIPELKSIKLENRNTTYFKGDQLNFKISGQYDKLSVDIKPAIVQDDMVNVAVNYISISTDTIPSGEYELIVTPLDKYGKTGAMLSERFQVRDYPLISDSDITFSRQPEKIEAGDILTVQISQQLPFDSYLWSLPNELEGQAEISDSGRYLSIRTISITGSVNTSIAVTPVYKNKVVKEREKSFTVVIREKIREPVKLELFPQDTFLNIGEAVTYTVTNLPIRSRLVLNEQNIDPQILTAKTSANSGKIEVNPTGQGTTTLNFQSMDERNNVTGQGRITLSVLPKLVDNDDTTFPDETVVAQITNDNAQTRRTEPTRTPQSINQLRNYTLFIIEPDSLVHGRNSNIRLEVQLPAVLRSKNLLFEWRLEKDSGGSPYNFSGETNGDSEKIVSNGPILSFAKSNQIGTFRPYLTIQDKDNLQDLTTIEADFLLDFKR